MSALTNASSWPPSKTTMPAFLFGGNLRSSRKFLSCVSKMRRSRHAAANTSSSLRPFSFRVCVSVALYPRFRRVGATSGPRYSSTMKRDALGNAFIKPWPLHDLCRSFARAFGRLNVYRSTLRGDFGTLESVVLTIRGIPPHCAALPVGRGESTWPKSRIGLFRRSWLRNPLSRKGPRRGSLRGWKGGENTMTYICRQSWLTFISKY